MTKKELMDLGLSEDLATKVEEAHKTELSNFIPKTRFDEVNQKMKDFEKLAEGAKDVDKLKQQIMDMTTAHQQALEAEQEKVKQVRMDACIEKAFTEAGAINVKGAKAMLDFDWDKAELDEKTNTIKGLSESIAKAKANDNYKFAYKEQTTETTPKFKGVQLGQADATKATDFQTRLNTARQNHDNVSAIAIKQEAIEAGVSLI